MTRTIIALGGGGFSMEDSPLLDRYVLAQSRRPRPKVLFLPHASGDSPSYVDRFEKAFAALECEPSWLSIFKPQTADLRALVLSQHVIYVGGGNTKSMLALWREWGIDTILREAWEAGIVLAGVSAGSMCWFSQGLTDSIPGTLTPLTCLGLLPGSNCPHYDGEAGRRPSYQRLIASGELSPGIAADEGVALHYVDTTLKRIVSSRPDAKAYRVDREGAAALERPLVPDYLGAEN